MVAILDVESWVNPLESIWVTLWSLIVINPLWMSFTHLQFVQFLFQISRVKVNLLYAKGKTKCQAASHANAPGKLAAKTGTGVQSEGKTRAHGRIPAHLWQLCSTCLVFSREKDVQLWTWPPLYGEGGLWSGPCGKGKIHPDRVEAEGISGTRRQSRWAKPLLGIRILLKGR